MKTTRFCNSLNIHIKHVSLSDIPTRRKKDKTLIEMIVFSKENEHHFIYYYSISYQILSNKLFK